MVEFDALRQLWQSQPDLAAFAEQVKEAGEALRKYSRRQLWIHIAKTVVVTGLLSWMFPQVSHSPMALCGVAFVAAGALVLLVMDWRNQWNTARLDFSMPSLGFVEDALGRLERSKFPLGTLFWVFPACFGVGLNLMLLGLNSRPQLWKHAVMTGLGVGMFFLGKAVRTKRFEHESRELRERLAAMRAALEERPL